MKVLITGGTGLVGKALARELVLRGHQVVIVSRQSSQQIAEFTLPFPHELVEGDLSLSPIPELSQKGIQAVVHLLGESLGQRWTTETKTKIYRSRVDSTENLKNSLGGAWNDVKVFVGASSIGFYGDAHDKALNESSPRGTGFFAELCEDWETAQSQIQLMSAQIRLVTLRLGLVLARDGGILRRLLPTFLAHLGGNLGSGQQWQSWIHIDDLVNLVACILENEKFAGVVNAVSPEPIRNKRLTLELERVLGVVAIAPLPTSLLEMLYGEMVDILLCSQRVYPHKALSLGFAFKFNLLKMALNNILGHHRQGEKELVNEVFVLGSLETVKEKYRGFQSERSTQREYQLALGKIKLSCQSVFEESVDGPRFIERQIKGPYKTWTRTLDFYPMVDGVLVRETIRFGFAMGWLSEWFGARRLVEQHLKQLN